MARAYGIAVIPNVVKVAVGVGGRRGSGAMVVRDANGKFSDPIMVSITGGNVGWQIGVQSTDIVLVFTTRKSIEGITDGKLTLGGDASVAAGPVGRAASAATDQNFTAEVYSYSRNRGLFAGVSLDGSVIAIDTKSNNKLYGKTAPATDIIAGHDHHRCGCGQALRTRHPREHCRPRNRRQRRAAPPPPRRIPAVAAGRREPRPSAPPPFPWKMRRPEPSRPLK